MKIVLLADKLTKFFPGLHGVERSEVSQLSGIFSRLSGFFSRCYHGGFTDFSRYGLPPGSADFRRIYEVETTASLLVEARHSSSNSLALHQLQQLLSHILKLIRFKVSIFQLLHILYILTLVHMMLKYWSALVRKFASGQACSSIIKGEGRVIPAFSYLLLQEGNEWLELCVPPAIRNLGMTRSRLQRN